jgi:hypothetical protein
LDLLFAGTGEFRKKDCHTSAYHLKINSPQ